MNHEMTRVSRLVNMIFFIQARPGITPAALAERFRDIRELENSRVPIYNDCGYRILNDWHHIFTFEKGENYDLSNKINS